MKKLYKDSLKLTTTGIGISMGAAIASEAGSADTASALGKFGKALPKVAGLQVAGILIDETKKLGKKIKL